MVVLNPVEFEERVRFHVQDGGTEVFGRKLLSAICGKSEIKQEECYLLNEMDRSWIECALILGSIIYIPHRGVYVGR